MSWYVRRSDWSTSGSRNSQRPSNGCRASADIICSPRTPAHFWAGVFAFSFGRVHGRVPGQRDRSNHQAAPS
jgi:hypothetical protein